MIDSPPLNKEEASPARKVLDKGFVRLVDFMGGDLAVVTAARVSYGSGTKGSEKDRRLISYLLRHDHMTPFEHSVFKFHVSCPIFVMRQWIRHRSSCITGDTQLFFDLPSGPRKGKRKAYRMSVVEFHRKWHEGARPIPHAKKPSIQVSVPQRSRLKRMLLRNLREDTWTFGHTHVEDIFKTGEKPVFELILEDGKIIRCTKEHRFLFESGWKTLEAATGLALTGKLATHGKSLPRLVVNGRSVENALYRDREWLERQYKQDGADDRSLASMLGVSPEVIRKWRRVHGLVNLKPKPFTKGMRPWNKNRAYTLGRREFAQEHLAAIRKARSGARSNFWKGGVSGPRAAISRWTTQAGPRVFARDGYRCRSCEQIGGKFHAHHVIPVWADPRRSLEESNLATLCETCHREIHGANSELTFAAQVLGQAAVRPYLPKAQPRAPAKPLLVPRLVGIKSITFIGVKPTFDLAVEGPFHNYVANGIVTHNSYNEISARYTEVKEEFYAPAPWRAPDAKNKQSSSPAPALDQDRCTRLLTESYEKAYAAYQELLAAGAARELARMVLPVSLYTQFYWTINARNLMHFISLRADAPAQWEIQRYAEALADDFAERMPWTWEAFLRHAWSGVNQKLDSQKQKLAGDPA